jgi:beta-galactosidase/beta-glucuronidase
LLAFPEIRIEDYHVQTLLDGDYVNAKLSVNVKLNAASKVNLRLFNANKEIQRAAL